MTVFTDLSIVFPFGLSRIFHSLSQKCAAFSNLHKYSQRLYGNQALPVDFELFQQDIKPGGGGVHSFDTLGFRFRQFYFCYDQNPSNKDCVYHYLHHQCFEQQSLVQHTLLSNSLYFTYLLYTNCKVLKLYVIVI